MNGHPDVVTCHWLTPTRILPHPYSYAAEARPWTCMREGLPHALDACDLESCPECPFWVQRTLDDVQRDIAYETWGVGMEIPPVHTIEDTRRELAWETFGVRV